MLSASISPSWTALMSRSGENASTVSRSLLPTTWRTAPAPNEMITCCMVPSKSAGARSEEHTSELQSLMRISYAVFCLKKKKKKKKYKKDYKHKKIIHICVYYNLSS